MRFIILGLIMQSLAFSSPIAFINAQIFDGINERKDADAFLVEDGRFKKIASTQEILTHVDLKQVVDLQSLRVMPGFIESHGHLLGLGLSLQKLDLRHLSITRIAELVKAQTERQAYGTWIQGRNWDQNIWPDKEFPTKEVLDKLSPNHPVYLRRVDGHAAWLNSLALERAGINKNSPDPKGGIIVRNEKGEASGVLIDNAMDLVNAILDKPSRLELEEQLALAMKEANRFGISSFHDAGASKEALELFRNFAQNNKLTLRIYAMIDGDNKDLLSSSLAKGPEVINDFLSIRAIKLFADGALGSRGLSLLMTTTTKLNQKALPSSLKMNSLQLAKKRSSLVSKLPLTPLAIKQTAWSLMPTKMH
jgi:predicted amidohydrolase YtcJ